MELAAWRAGLRRLMQLLLVRLLFSWSALAGKAGRIRPPSFFRRARRHTSWRDRRLGRRKHAEPAPRVGAWGLGEAGDCPQTMCSVFCHSHFGPRVCGSVFGLLVRCPALFRQFAGLVLVRLCDVGRFTFASVSEFCRLRAGGTCASPWFRALCIAICALCACVAPAFLRAFLC